MNSDEQLERVLNSCIVAVMRAPSGDALVDVAEALLAGGVQVMEVTFTVPGAVRVLEQVADRLGDRILLGAGTVLDPETARTALLSRRSVRGFPVIEPGCDPHVSALRQARDAGALTPTEVITAWEAGAHIVKIFPADLGGPSYLKALQGPLPQVRLMPTGGVDLQTAESFLRAGACALGVGGSLVSKKVVESRDVQQIETLARQFVAVVKKFRESR